MKQTQKILLSLLLFFNISCANPNNLITSNHPELKPNVFMNIDKNKGTHNFKLCINDILNIKGSKFINDIGKDLNIWIEEPPKSIPANPRDNMLPPLYRPSFKLGSTKIDTTGSFNFIFQLKDKYSPTNRNTEMIIEKGKNYILYFQYGDLIGEEGGSFNSSSLSICN